MLNFLNLPSVVFVPNENANCFFIAFFVDLVLELRELLVKAELAALVF